MNQQQSNIKPLAVMIVIAAAIAVGTILRAHANEPAAASFPCAILESASGEAEVLDSSRTHLAEAVPNAPIPCGGWVSVSRGVAKVKHRFGYELHLGPGTFAQFNDAEDAILLFKGQLYSEAGGGMGELRILTPNGQVRTSRASAITIFDSEEEKTQLISLEGTSSLTNRFDSAAVVQVKAGQASDLDFKLLRVVPSVPKIVAVASLKEKETTLEIPVKSGQKTYAVIRNREKQAFAEQEKALQPTDGENQANTPPTLAGTHKKGGRKIASLPAVEGSGDDSTTDTYWQAKAVGGDTDGLELLTPQKSAPKRKKTSRHLASAAKVSVEDATDTDDDGKTAEKKKLQDGAEKRRLIEELSEIKSE